MVSLLEVDATTTAPSKAVSSLDDGSLLTSGTLYVAGDSSNARLWETQPGGGTNSAVSKVIVESVMFSI